MLYRLLRNNKESGPYTALQLKEMGLKPYDLLWAEGRGAAWQYASELAELKAFAPTVEEQPFDRFFKKKEEQPAAIQQTIATVKKQKPRFRISGDKVIMVEAGNMEVATNGVIKETAPVRLPKEASVKTEKAVAATDWQEMYPEWQPPQKTAVKKEEPVAVETKYSESLDDLKKRYAEKVLNEKGGKLSSVSSASVKQNIMAAVALIVLVIGGYIGYTLKQKDAAVTQGKPAVERADLSSDNTLSTPSTDDNTSSNNTSEKKENAIPQSTSPNRNSGQANGTKTDVVNTPAISVAKNVNDNKQASLIAQNKEANTSAIANAIIKKGDDKTPVVKKEMAKENNNNVPVKPLPQPVATTAKTTSNNIVTTPAETKPIAKPNAAKKIDDYISVKKVGGSAIGVQNVSLLVSNVSDFPIDLAVIDIQYFDSKGKYQKGETMYVKNIDGGNNVEVRVPDSDKASSIKYKVSLVQSEEKTLYLVAD